MLKVIFLKIRLNIYFILEIFYFIDIVEHVFNVHLVNSSFSYAYGNIYISHCATLRRK